MSKVAEHYHSEDYETWLERLDRERDLPEPVERKRYACNWCGKVTDVEDICARCRSRGPGAWHEAVLDLPEGRVEGWTVWTERGSFEGKERRLRLVNLPATVAVTIRGAAPAVASLEVRYAAKSPELIEPIRRMPEWTAPDGTVVVRRRIGM